MINEEIRHVNDYPSGNQEEEECTTAQFAVGYLSGAPISVHGSAMVAVAAGQMDRANPTECNKKRMNVTVGEEPTRGKLDTSQINEYYGFCNRNNMCELREVVLLLNWSSDREREDWTIWNLTNQIVRIRDSAMRVWKEKLVSLTISTKHKTCRNSIRRTRPP